MLLPLLSRKWLQSHAGSLVKQAFILMRAELELLLTCAGATLTVAQKSRLARLVRQPLAWEAVLRLAQRHGLVPLLCHHLSREAEEFVPPALMECWRDLATHNAWHALRLSEELCRVLAALQENEVLALPYKGPLLAQTLYGDITLRQFNDLDILVARTDVTKAVAILEKCGYRQELQLTPNQARQILKNDCEYALKHDAKAVHLDLHWHFAPRHFALRIDLPGIWQRARPVTLDGAEIMGLAAEDTLLMLALNGSKDYWSRLLTLCDIAALVRQTPQIDWPQLWQRATAARVQRMLGLSLWLAQELLETSLPLFVRQQLENDAALPRLAAHVKSFLLGDGLQYMSLDSYLLPARTLPNRLAQMEFYFIFALQPSFEDWSFAEFPARLDFLYYLTRPLRLAKKYFLANNKQ